MLTRHAQGQPGKSPEGWCAVSASCCAVLCHQGIGLSSEAVVGMDPTAFRARSAQQWVVLVLFAYGEHTALHSPTVILL